ncbi:MAG: sodium-independent anion transporter [Acidimicrobiia bacterium]
MGDRSLYGTPEAPQPPKDRGPLLHGAFPVTRRLRGYSLPSLRTDGVAGVTVAALALPSGMAYAQLAGLSPVAGLYALLLPAVAYALLGSSRQLIVGPEGALAVLVATAVAPLAGNDPEKFAALAAMLAVLVGGVAVVAWIVRLGWISDYFSRSVLVGYIHGVAIVLIIGQLGKLLGLSIDADDPLPQLAEVVREIGDAHGLTILVALVSLVLLLVLRWRFPKVPGALIVVVGGIVVSAAFGLVDEGVKVVGNIPSGLPSLAWPDVSLGDATELLPAAVGIFAVGYADAILTARSFAGRHNENVDANQELLALGAANAAAGISQAFPVGASGSRTAVNDQMGGKTQLVGVIAAGVIALVLLFFTAPVEKLPSACLGAVIVAAGIGLIEPKAWRALAHVSRFEVVIAAVTFVGVLVLGVLVALLVAVALSIVDYIARSAKPHDAVLGWVPRLGRYANVALHRRARLTQGVVVYRFDGKLFFANAQYFAGRVLEAIDGAPTETRWVVLDAEGMNGIDASGAEALEQLVNGLRGRGIGLVVARLKTPVRDVFDASGLTELIGSDRFPPSVEAGVEQCAGPDT